MEATLRFLSKFSYVKFSTRRLQKWNKKRGSHAIYWDLMSANTPRPPSPPFEYLLSIYARVLDYSYLCDYGISKFSGGACPQIPPARRALPILCLGVKLSSPPIQNHKKPVGVSHTKRSWSGAVRAPRSADCFPRCLSGAQQRIWQV